MTSSWTYRCSPQEGLAHLDGRLAPDSLDEAVGAQHVVQVHGERQLGAAHLGEDDEAGEPARPAQLLDGDEALLRAFTVELRELLAVQSPACRQEHHPPGDEPRPEAHLREGTEEGEEPGEGARRL